MDKLKLAFKLVIERAKEKRSTGAVPSFLGVRGMLALMYDRIVAFSEDNEDSTEYILDLAVNAVFAFSTVLPEMDFEEITDEEPQEETDEIPADETQEDESSVDSRWTPIPPGSSIPVAEKVTDE